MNHGQLQRYAGYPCGNTSLSSDSTKASVDNAHLDQDWYTIRQWLGMLGGNR